MNYDIMMKIRKRLGLCVTDDAVIAISTSLSGEIDVRGFNHLSIQLPSGWDSADIALHASHESGGTFALVRDANNVPEIIDGVAASGFYVVRNVLEGLGFIKLASVSITDPTAAENQTAARTIGYSLES